MDDTPHILFAAYQADRGANGGMESATMVFEALTDDFYWTLITNRETPRTDRWRAGGARVVRFKFDQEAGKNFRAIQLGSAALKALGQRADILHANDIRSAQALLLNAWVRRRPLALTVRDTKPDQEPYAAHWHRVAQRLDALVTLSDDMARRVGELLPVRASRRHTINSIVDLDNFKRPDPAKRVELRARLGIEPHEIAIGIVAGVFDKKRQLEVIRNVLPRLMDLPVRLHLVGDFKPSTDPYARACAEMVVAQNLGNRVFFHGFRRDVADWLAAIDIVLVASQREGLARCMIEAMACSTPVVSVDVCSAREMLEATGAGIVVGLNDWSALSGALRELCIDAKKRTSMGQAGREAAMVRFSAEHVADDWRSLYRGIAAKRK